jgi:hypothetical protein
MGGGIQIIHEVKLLAAMAHFGDLDAAIQQLVDIVIQRYLFGSI